jgi:hypothetical protein
LVRSHLAAGDGRRYPDVVTTAEARVRGLTYVGTEIPASHRDLVECPPVAAMTTVMPDGTPQTSAVW